MITFHLENCVTLTIRSSGTEPKIKWYSEIVSEDANARGILVEWVDKAVQELMQPNHFGFEMRIEAEDDPLARISHQDPDFAV